MKFSKGDAVAFLNETGGGVVIEYTKQNKVKLLNDDGFVVESYEKDLVQQTKQQTYNNHLKNSTKDKQPKTLQSAQSDSKTITIDLHIESLTETTLGMDNQDILRLQISRFKQTMERGFEKKIRSIVFIHGVGEGVLKSEILLRLKQYEDISWHAAPMKKYGSGATKVIFH